jgi:hypothetical protein
MDADVIQVPLRACAPTHAEVWESARRRWGEAVHRGLSWCDDVARVREAFSRDTDTNSDLTSVAFSSPLDALGTAPNHFHILLGFATCAACPGFEGARLEIGGREYGESLDVGPGATTMFPALTLPGGKGYAVPILEYHVVRLRGVPRDGSVYAVGVRVSPAAAAVLARQPNLIGDEVAFAFGCAMPPPEVFARIPELDPRPRPLSRLSSLSPGS